MSHIPVVHLPAAAWTIVLAVAVAAILLLMFGRPIRRHLVRLAGSVIFGAVTAFAVTDWADGHRRAALARQAHAHASVTGMLADTFAVTTVIAAAAAFTAASLVARRRRVRAYGPQPGARAW